MLAKVLVLSQDQVRANASNAEAGAAILETMASKSGASSVMAPAASRKTSAQAVKAWVSSAKS